MGQYIEVEVRVEEDGITMGRLIEDCADVGYLIGQAIL